MGCFVFCKKTPKQRSAINLGHYIFKVHPTFYQEFNQ